MTISALALHRVAYFSASQNYHNATQPATDIDVDFDDRRRWPFTLLALSLYQRMPVITR